MKRNNIQEIIDAYDAYIELLNKEIQSMFGLCYAHGWKSSLVKEGKAARKRIAEAIGSCNLHKNISWRFISCRSY